MSPNPPSKTEVIGSSPRAGGGGESESGGGGYSWWWSVRISFKNEDNGGAPPKEVGRDRSQLCSNRVPPTLELEKKTEDAEELPTQCGGDGK